MKKTDKFIWREGEITISQCIDCRHWVKGGACAAFPGGVPEAIKNNEVSHKNPYPGDNGVRYERLTNAKV